MCLRVASGWEFIVKRGWGGFLLYGEKIRRYNEFYVAIGNFKGIINETDLVGFKIIFFSKQLSFSVGK